MRPATLTLVAFASLAIAGFAACSESFSLVPGDAGADASVDGGPLEATPPAIVAEPDRVNASSSSVAYDAARRAVWTANGDVGTVSYVDPSSRTLVQELHVGGDVGGSDIRSIAISPDGVWVAVVDRGLGTLSLLDAGSRTIRRTIALGSHPRACVWDAANPRWLYVTEEDSGAVLIVDRTLGAVIATLPVGRSPAGLAVSATHRELYVSHRIDAEVTVIDLRDRSVATQVPLADEPFTAATVPNGKPLAFESIAVTMDGNDLWAPHELLATTHPFVFNQTVFPAVSVVDLIARIEQQSDPSGAEFAGRKNLFSAINLAGPDGQPSIFSQPCGIAFHPNNHLAWVLMCGSQDLVTFNVGHGNATDALRGLPCDHPSGMTLDAAGARLFVMCDQSKQLLTFDTAGGSPVGHTQLYGAPIDVAVDTVELRNPQLRAGLTLFYQANSAKGAAATTGNDWMSCSACHLDGFGSSNLRLFEALLPPADPARDAQIGHVGLVDNFSTAVPPPHGSLLPHDFIVALLEQGGLAPDRTGADRTGQVNPTPTPMAQDPLTVAALTMAQQLALVVAADLPTQPTWLRGAPPDPKYTPEWCGGCHATEYEAWRQSVHAHAGQDPMVLFCVKTEQGLAGPQYSRLCAGCHDPVSTRAGDTSMTSGQGVTCLGCHDVTALTRAGGNADLLTTPHDWSADHKAWGLASLELLKQPAFCGGCHQQFVPGTGLIGIGTLDEYQTSLYAPATRCVDCHMKPVAAGGYDHRFPGGNVYLGQLIGDATLRAAQTYNLQHVVQMEARSVPGGVLVTVRNGGAGHWFPTGVTDIREPWVELQPKDAAGNVLDHIGGPTLDTNLLPAGAARLGVDLAQADGKLLTHHEISLATRVPFDVRVPSGEAQTFLVPVASLPPGTASIDAVLEYRNVRTTYYQAVTTTDGGVPQDGGAPQTEMARVRVVAP